MLVDATHLEETRVVVLDGTRLEEFDVETSTKKQIKGNIYLAKVVRVEPSLQAAFVDYGGNRHGFLAFSEIHPDYYQIPVADRERLLAEVDKHHEEDESSDSDAADTLGQENDERQEENVAKPSDVTSQNEDDVALSNPESVEAIPMAFNSPQVSGDVVADATADTSSQSNGEIKIETAAETGAAEPTISESSEDVPSGTPDNSIEASSEFGEFSADPGESSDESTDEPPSAPVKSTKSSGVETVGGDDDDESAGEDRQRQRFLASRHYKIQEVIKRRQIMLVQVVKEERGSKGAALTSFLSLAGRYCVLMPNSARGGGVSRKITSSQDRRRLKAILGDLELPKSMAVILRTAGADRNKAEIKRDYEYLQRTWNSTREETMTSRAPALIHEEASLIKRAIRDVYTRDIEEVWVDGEEGYKTAKDFMKMLTPSHAKKVQKYKDETIPLFHRYQVETQLEAINNPIIQLKSGGSIVFAQTEALVAIDVNSGRSTKERHKEETAYRTNLEAAEEIARQLRLRDLAGLVVIDFIDMEENRNNHAVERRLKEALRADRARIQVGRISHFGLLELSRQRLRPSLIEANFRICSHCSGAGLVRSTESAAVHSLRVLEEEGVRHRSSEVTITVHSDVALYLLNYKRQALASIETRYGIKIFILGDNALVPPDMRLDRVKASRGANDDLSDSPVQPQAELESHESEAPEAQPSDAKEDLPAPRTDDEDGSGRKRRRRRRKKRIGEPRVAGQEGQSAESVSSTDDENKNEELGTQNLSSEADSSTENADAQKSESSRDEAGPRVRRRGRRGGRRRRGAKDAHGSTHADEKGTNDSSSGPATTENQDTAAPPDLSPPERSMDAVPTVTDDGNQAATASTQVEGGSEVGSRGPSRLFRTLWKREPEPTERPAETKPVVAPPSPEPPPQATAPSTASPRRGWWQSSDEP